MCAGTDATTFKLFSSQNGVVAENVYVRAVSLHSAGEDDVWMCPAFIRSTEASYKGVTSVLSAGNLTMSDFAGDGQTLKIVFLTLGNHTVNRKSARHLVQQFDRFPNVLVATVICYAHVLSRAALWGGLNFPVGDVLRFSHFLRCRPLKQLGRFCSTQLSDDIVDAKECNLGSSGLIW